MEGLDWGYSVKCRIYVHISITHKHTHTFKRPTLLTALPPSRIITWTPFGEKKVKKPQSSDQPPKYSAHTLYCLDTFFLIFAFPTHPAQTGRRQKKQQKTSGDATSKIRLNERRRPRQIH